MNKALIRLGISALLENVFERRHGGIERLFPIAENKFVLHLSAVDLRKTLKQCKMRLDGERFVILNVVHKAHDLAVTEPRRHQLARF